MESTMHMAPILLDVPLILTTLIFVFGLILFKRKAASGCLPPGPMGVPLLGRLPFLSTNMHRCFADVSKSYGPISSFRLGTRLCVVISTSSAARAVLRDQDTVFASHSVPEVANIVTKGGLDILWAPYGPYWRFARRVVMRELLNSSVINSFRSLRRREVHRMIRELQTRAGSVVDIHEAVSSTAVAVILGMMWDDAMRDGTGNMGGLAEEVKDIIDGVVVVSGLPNVSDFIPSLAPLDLQGLQRRMKALSKRYDSVFDDIVELKAKKKGHEEDNVDDDVKAKPKDFLQLMLNLVATKELGTELEMEHIKAIILDLITAAIDTTTSTVEWAMTELARNPEMMAKAQAELDEVVGVKGILEESHLPKLHYLDAVVKETFRMYPVLPLMVPHTPNEVATIDGYTIPPGSRVFVNVWAIQRDPSVWEQPHEFKPERFFFQEEDRANKKWDYNGRSFDFLPFGKGRRMCPGMNLGERMVVYMLGTLVHSLKWGLPEGVPCVDVEEKFMVVLKKKEPLMLVPCVRMPQYSQSNLEESHAA